MTESTIKDIQFWGFVLVILLSGVVLGGGIENRVDWVPNFPEDSTNEALEKAEAPIPTTGPLSFTVAMNGMWKYECTSMEFIGPTDPDFQP